VLRTALTRQKEQIELVPSGGGRWISMNTTVKPFDDINVRKAVAAGMDRDALRLTRGGALLGDIATHYLPPNMAGFEEAGGMEGTGVDYLSKDGKPLPEVSAKYFKAAGYASGKYEGNEEILMVGSNAGVAAKTAEVVKENLERMGFKVQMRLVAQNTMYTKYCNSPSANVAVCPNVGWLKDFPDGQTILSPTFAGKNILEPSSTTDRSDQCPRLMALPPAAELAATATSPPTGLQAARRTAARVTSQPKRRAGSRVT
jgi:peptide/nickel transport system substrate-binding protein